MCGADPSQQGLEQEQIQAYKQAEQMTAQQYAEYQSVTEPMAAMFSSIFAGGPNQQGYSAPELDTLNAQAKEGTAENYKQAAAAVNEQMAAEGGGNNPLPTGGQEQLREQVGESAASNESNEETQIKEAGFTQGHNEWLEAAQGLQAIASGANPSGYEEAATGAGSAAATTANEIAQENDSWVNAALGAAGSIGAAALTKKP